VIERLLEAWLDSASERSYQIPFCQMLMADGHRLIHSTRHSPIELGKDIVTIAGDGTSCAYQLKGNPGGRLTLAQFRAISGQLHELATLPLPFSSVPADRWHRSYLVTNGEVDEEARLAIEKQNEGFQRTGSPARVEIISRGMLLDSARRLGVDLWPSELADIQVLLQMLVDRGDGPIPADRLHALLEPVLRLTEDEDKPSKEDIHRRIRSAALLVQVALRSFSIRENHTAILFAWTMYFSYVVGCCERHDVTLAEVEDSLDLAQMAMLASLGAICDELSMRDHYIEGEPLVDALFYRARLTLVTGLMSVYFLWADDADALPAERRAFLERFLAKGFGGMELWGEGALPSFLAYLWYRRRTDATVTSDFLLAHLLERLLAAKRDPRTAPPSPYFSFEDILRHQLRPLGIAADDALTHESSDQTSFFAESLFRLLVRTGLKSTCKEHWPALSRITFREFVPEKRWRFCLWRTGYGREVTTIPPLGETWANATQAARYTGLDRIPRGFTTDSGPFVLLLFILLCPYRATPAALSFLGWKLDPVWWIPPPIHIAPAATTVRGTAAATERGP
jgi:hypothetical protein